LHHFCDFGEVGGVGRVESWHLKIHWWGRRRIVRVEWDVLIRKRRGSTAHPWDKRHVSSLWETWDPWEVGGGL
jgi:hypothetical protein